MLDRRHILGMTGIGLLAGGLPVRADDHAHRIVALAQQAMARHGAQAAPTGRIAVADFSSHSSLPRFHILNLNDGHSQSFLVAHGKGSDPAHTGRLQSFSDIPGSEATSEGVYLTGEDYTGKHGLSRRLIGLDSTNTNALTRAIVIHAAWYVGPDMVAQHGKLGRSQGCFAFSKADLQAVLNLVPPGSLIVSARA